MIKLNRFPTVQEAAEASKASGLPESYWWIRGGNLNRPVIAEIGVGAHIKTGSYVWVIFGDNCPVGGLRVTDLAAQSFELQGPIPPPDFK